MKYIISILLICACTRVQAQVNLVLNPSFEDYATCPENEAQVTYSYNWMALDTLWTAADSFDVPDGAPTYCNICAWNITTRVPNNAAFYHYCRTGGGMMDLIMYHDDYLPDTGFSRSYLQGHLSHTLTTSHTYLVTFYTVLENTSAYAINHIGAYFDDGNMDTAHNTGIPQTACTPQILDTAIISDTLNWTKIQGTFTATGMERYITIGNFSDCAHTHAVPTIDTTGAWAAACSSGGVMLSGLVVS